MQFLSSISSFSERKRFDWIVDSQKKTKTFENCDIVASKIVTSFLLILKKSYTRKKKLQIEI